MSSANIQDELSALRSRKLARREADRLKDLAPMQTPEVVKASLSEHRANLGHVDRPAPVGTPTSAPTGKAAADVQGEWHLRQRAERLEEKRRREEAAENLRGYKMKTGGGGGGGGGGSTGATTGMGAVAPSSSSSSSLPPKKSDAGVARAPPSTADAAGNVAGESTRIDVASSAAAASIPSAEGTSETTVVPVEADDGSSFDESDDDDDDVPDLEEQVPDDGAPPTAPPNATRDDADSGRPALSRSERKSRKMVQRLGMRPVPGILRVAIRTGRDETFVIDRPDVFRSGGGGTKRGGGPPATYVVFGEGRPGGAGADAAPGGASVAATEAAAAARQFRQLKPSPRGVTMPQVGMAGSDGLEEVAENGDGGDELSVDETGVDAKDVELVMAQATCARSEAVAALKENDGDLVNAIMALTT